jgi:hypothetical protein
MRYVRVVFGPADKFRFVFVRDRKAIAYLEPAPDYVLVRPNSPDESVIPGALLKPPKIQKETVRPYPLFPQMALRRALLPKEKPLAALGFRAQLWSYVRVEVHF